MSTTKMMEHNGEIWVAHPVHMDAIQLISRQKGMIDAHEKELERLREIACKVALLSGKIQMMDDRQRELLRNRPSSDRPFLVGYYEPRGQTFIRAASRTVHPDLALTHHIPVYVLPEP